MDNRFNQLIYFQLMVNPAGFGSDPDPVTGRVRVNPPGTQVRHERVAPLIWITASIS